MSDDLIKLTQAVYETSELNMHNYEYIFQEEIESDPQLVSIPAKWIDFNHLFRLAIRENLVPLQDYGPFSPDEKFNEFFGGAAQTLAKFINITYRAITQQCLSSLVHAGFLAISGIDESGNVRYGVGNATEDEKVLLSIEKTLGFLERWNKVEGQ